MRAATSKIHQAKTTQQPPSRHQSRNGLVVSWVDVFSLRQGTGENREGDGPGFKAVVPLRFESVRKMIVYMADSGNEERLHFKFRNLREVREWFRYEGKLKEYVENVPVFFPNAIEENKVGDRW
jgi:hypothetical protein